MKMFNKFSFLLLIIILPLILLQCTKYKEESPFFDGLFLEYDRGGGSRTIYNVQVLENYRFKITETRKREPLSDDVEELFVDSYGRVYKSSFEDYEGGFSPIWIPVHEMEIGDTFDDGYAVLREDTWKKWKVLVVKNPIVEEERYYDLNTGYWVGLFAKTPMGVVAFVLVNTNADIPTAKE